MIPFGHFLEVNDGAGIPLGADDCTIDGTSSPCIFVVLRPVLFDCAARFTDILEIGMAEVLMLVNVKPKIEDIFCAFTSPRRNNSSRARKYGLWIGLNDSISS